MLLDQGLFEKPGSHRYGTWRTKRKKLLLSCTGTLERLAHPGLEVREVKLRTQVSITVRVRDPPYKQRKLCSGCPLPLEGRNLSLTLSQGIHSGNSWLSPCHTSPGISQYYVLFRTNPQEPSSLSLSQRTLVCKRDKWHHYWEVSGMLLSGWGNGLCFAQV